MKKDSPPRHRVLTCSSLNLPVLLFIQKQANIVPHYNLPSNHRRHKAGFLNLNAMEIWGWIILSAGLGEEAVYIVESLAASLTSTHYMVVGYFPPLLSQQKMFSSIAKSPLVEIH